jgi:hypothetical protein
MYFDATKRCYYKHPTKLLLNLKLAELGEVSRYGEQPTGEIDLLKPTGHVIHQQFDIQQLYALPTLYLCILYLSENK